MFLVMHVCRHILNITCIQTGKQKCSLKPFKPGFKPHPIFVHQSPSPILRCQQRMSSNRFIWPKARKGDDGDSVPVFGIPFHQELPVSKGPPLIPSIMNIILCAMFSVPWRLYSRLVSAIAASSPVVNFPKMFLLMMIAVNEVSADVNWKGSLETCRMGISFYTN